jgi:ELWxxDGT repeat protein
LDWNSLTEFKDKLYFSAEIFDNNLCVSDGTEEGTKQISPILITDDSRGYYPKIFVNGDYMLISAYDSIHGYELWKSDGTKEGTILLKDIYDTIQTGINNFKINPLITLYPNPAGDRINLKFSSNYQGQVEIAIMNFLGQTMQIWKGELKNDYVKEMSLENYNPGFYFITTKYGNQAVSLPFIKR